MNFLGYHHENVIAFRDEEVLITKNGAPAAVLISPDEYESWQETLAIRSDKELTAEIQSGLASFKKKKVKIYTLEELLNQ
jgi:PHD/YefM family antitoxin component YafN of YafNO toxin-antitoxin module